jgi:hypothetical protein
MKEHPILFSTEMVQAILNGHKTKTRRIVKPQPNSHDPGNFPWLIEEGCEPKPIKCPFGHPGDLLWVKETFFPMTSDLLHPDCIVYKASTGNPEKYKWKPSLFMHKESARIWLEISEVRAQRLQDISEEDATAEGIEQIESAAFGKVWRNYGPLDADEPYFFNPIDSFASLWDSINSKPKTPNVKHQTLNPWVWAITFKVISTNGKPNLKPQT